MSPLLSPKIFKAEKNVTGLIVHLNKLFRLLLLYEGRRELLHWARDSMEQVSRPCDATSNSGQVSHYGRIVLILLVLILNLVNLQAIVVEKNGILGVNGVAKVTTLEDSLKLSKELQRVFDGCDNFKVLIDVLLQFSLHS